MSDSTSSGGGTGFCGLLLIAFIVLKLTDTIDWSWWWVMSPLWIPIAFAIVGIPAVIVLSARGATKKKRS